MTVTSGRRCFELYGNSARCGSLVKMCLESSIWHSTKCALRWKVRATKSNRLLFQLAALTHRTNEKECLLWPTPQTGAALYGGTGNLRQLQKLALAGILNSEEVRNLSSGSGGKTNPALLEWLMGYEQKFTELIPTPRACDYKGASAKRFFGGAHYRAQLCELIECTPLGIVGRLNPTYLEWLMGYPIGWTELNHSETP